MWVASRADRIPARADSEGTDQRSEADHQVVPKTCGMDKSIPFAML